ncbi:hypothetical protein HPB47_002625, partial [Ixodes persulcatus]
YGRAVKLVLTCSSYDFIERHFSSPRVAGAAKITPFEINLRAMKVPRKVKRERLPLRTSVPP